MIELVALSEDGPEQKEARMQRFEAVVGSAGVDRTQLLQAVQTEIDAQLSSKGYNAELATKLKFALAKIAELLDKPTE